MPQLTRDGTSLFYERDDGPSDTAPVVLLQGLGLGRWSWRWQRDALAEDRRVIVPDTRGTGRSALGLPPLVGRVPDPLRRRLPGSVAGYSVSGLVADLEAVLEDARLRRVHLVGLGLGGVIAQVYAAEHSRVETLTLCGTTSGGDTAVPMPEDVRKQAFDSPSGTTDRDVMRDRTRPLFAERFVNRNPHLLEQIVEWRLEQDAGPAAQWAQLAALSGFDAGDRLDRIRAPTLVLHGRDDRVIPPENAEILADAIPNARLEYVDGGHLFPIESAAETTSVLREAVSDRPESAADPALE
ncbi:alpha/beta hydrolase [Halobacteria archaeon AArc-dxtr1]|nr:alpha/beta hydrolase [Halobacteria archaeon AArc-dxtr1]